VVVVRHASEIPRLTNTGRWATAALATTRNSLGLNWRASRRISRRMS